MGKEIERKYLIKTDNYRSCSSKKYYKQGYLSTSEERVVRIRIIEEKGFITIKGKNKGATRLEYEYQIPVNEANELIDTLCIHPIIEKFRYTCKIDDLTWEIDEFLGDNTGLVIAEVELPEENYPITLPAWIGKEVTSDTKYYNSNLVKHPYKEWK